MQVDQSATLSCPMTLPSARCVHCQSLLSGKFAHEEFCCTGCEAVYRYINRIGLSKFYQLLASQAIAKAETDTGHLLELYDQTTFTSSFCLVEGDGRKTARLFVRGLDCYACVWLIQSYLEKQFPTVNVILSVSESEISITFDPEAVLLSKVVGEIQRLGFSVQPETSIGAGQARAEGLIRIGVNAFCFVNVMMLALPDYVDEKLIGDFGFWQLFRYISLFLTTIVMTYGALPFYRSSWISLKNYRATVDLPISLALLTTYTYSAINTLRGDGPVYFDSVSIVVTLILTSRFFHGTIVKKAERTIRGKFDFSFDYVKQEVGGKKLISTASSLKTGAQFYVLPGDPVPLRSRVLAGNSEIHYGQITGEAELFPVGEGAVINSGAIVSGRRLDLISLEDGDISYVAKIKAALDHMAQDRGRYAQFSDKLGTGFFLLVLLVAAGIFWHFWSISPEIALERTVSALLIACPCAFALSVPLTMTMCTALGARHGIIFKNQRAIEILGKVKKIFFDKTGTLTVGTPKLVDFWLSEAALTSQELTRDDVFTCLARLEKFSSHHVPVALAEAIREMNRPEILSDLEPIEVIEEFGKGLRIQWREKLLLLGKGDFCQICDDRTLLDYNVFLSIEGQQVGAFLLDDRFVPDALSTIVALQAEMIQVGIISGDNENRTQLAAKKLNIAPENVFTEQSPFQKISWVKGQGEISTAMVGNGFNDSLALSASGVGISVASASQKAKEAASINIEKPGIAPIILAIELCRTANRKVISAFSFAVFFNLIGLSLAAFGMMKPVIAAVLMPCSSVVVTLISLRWKPAKF
jgi:Cu2+-exporting ATPase